MNISYDDCLSDSELDDLVCFPEDTRMKAIKRDENKLSLPILENLNSTETL